MLPESIASARFAHSMTPGDCGGGGDCVNPAGYGQGNSCGGGDSCGSLVSDGGCGGGGGGESGGGGSQEKPSHPGSGEKPAHV